MNNFYRSSLEHTPSGFWDTALTTYARTHQPLRSSAVTEGDRRSEPRRGEARRIAPERLKIAKADFAASKSPWLSPLHMEPKQTPNEWRPCGDFRTLNARVIPDGYPVRHVQDFTAQLRGSLIFTVIDLVKAYTLIPIYPPDIPPKKTHHDTVSTVSRS